MFLQHFQQFRYLIFFFGKNRQTNHSRRKETAAKHILIHIWWLNFIRKLNEIYPSMETYFIDSVWARSLYGSFRVKLNQMVKQLTL